MGACTFYTTEKGKTAEEAFRRAVAQARHEYGYGGYSGTIAEKSKFKVIPCPKDKAPMEHADELLENDDPRMNDKWGPAGCIETDDGKYLFFGWASS